MIWYPSIQRDGKLSPNLMRTSNQPSLHEIAAVFQLVGECRELWADADGWQQHLIRGACDLTGTSVGTFTVSRLSADRKCDDIYSEADRGWRDATARSHWSRIFVDHPNRVAFLPRCYQLAGMALDSGNDEPVTATRPEMRSDAEWYRSVIFNEYYRPAGIDGFIMSFAVNRKTGNLITLNVCQDLKDPAPTRRAKAILSLLNRQIAPLVGVALATNSDRGISGLSPRLRQTLEALLAGDSEKQVAAYLDVSRPTAHEYIGAIYRHFHVSSRAELMAYFLRRRPEPRNGCAVAPPAAPQLSQ